MSSPNLWDAEQKATDAYNEAVAAESNAAYAKAHHRALKEGKSAERAAVVADEAAKASHTLPHLASLRSVLTAITARRRAVHGPSEYEESRRRPGHG